jgi:hypothetical protein
LIIVNNLFVQALKEFRGGFSMRITNLAPSAGQLFQKLDQLTEEEFFGGPLIGLIFLN